MNMGVENKLKQLRAEDKIWLIYIGIIFLSWYSNSLERKYFTFNDQVSKEKYRKIIIFIFSILIIVYFYFLKSSVNDIKNIKPTDSERKKTLVYLSFFGSFFILVSGLIFLFIALVDDELSVELAFN